MVAEDGGETAVLKAPKGAIILKFPSAAIGEGDQVVNSLHQNTSIEGTLVRIGGIGTTRSFSFRKWTALSLLAAPPTDRSPRKWPA